MVEQQAAPERVPSLASAGDISPLSKSRAGSASWVLSLSTFGFALLQSVCTAILALSGLRLLIGAGAFAFAWSGILLVDRLHAEAIRLPMIAFALVGSAVNLYVIWRIRSLRSRPSSAWRVKPATPKQERSELLQIAIAIGTLVLVGAELAAHILHFGSLFA